MPHFQTNPNLQLLLSETQVWVVNVGLASHFCWFNRSTMGGSPSAPEVQQMWQQSHHAEQMLKEEAILKWEVYGLRHWVYHCSMIVILVGSQTSNRITNSKKRSTMIKSPHSYALLLYYYVFLFGEMIQYPKSLLSRWRQVLQLTHGMRRAEEAILNRPRNGSGAVCFDVLGMIGGDLNFGRHQFFGMTGVFLSSKGTSSHGFY